MQQCTNIVIEFRHCYFDKLLHCTFILTDILIPKLVILHTFQDP